MNYSEDHENVSVDIILTVRGKKYPVNTWRRVMYDDDLSEIVVNEVLDKAVRLCKMYYDSKSKEDLENR